MSSIRFCISFKMCIISVAGDRAIFGRICGDWIRDMSLLFNEFNAEFVALARRNVFVRLCKNLHCAFLPSVRHTWTEGDQPSSDRVRGGDRNLKI